MRFSTEFFLRISRFYLFPMVFVLKKIWKPTKMSDYFIKEIQNQLYLLYSSKCLLKRIQSAFHKYTVLKMKSSTIPRAVSSEPPPGKVSEFATPHTLRWIGHFCAYNLCSLFVNLRMFGAQIFVISTSGTCNATDKYTLWTETSPI